MTSLLEQITLLYSDLSYITKNDEAVNSIVETVKTIETKNYSAKDTYARLAEVFAYKTLDHPEWSQLAGRIKTRELKLTTGASFSETTHIAKILLNEEYYNFVQQNKDKLNSIIVESRDNMFDWFGICTGIQSYFLKLDGVCVETPQQMFLRVATWLHMPSIEKIIEVYDDLSMHNYMHATPTLFNSGTRRPQLSSCFLMTIGDDMECISKSWHDVAMISKNSGGIGIDVSDLRHSKIGNSSDGSGIVPMLRVTNNILAYIDQNGRRKGSCAVYLSDYHIDIFEFLELKKNVGEERLRARELFYALWISDLFMKRVERDEMWSLFCPNIAKGLNDVWGDKFEKLYITYEAEGKYTKQVPARKLWQAIYIAQVEMGMPYILFKDSANRKSNQQNLGTIRCSNLCAEILEYTSKDEIASCTLANIVLNKCVKHIIVGGKKTFQFDFAKLERLARSLVRNLNEVIDRNYYMDKVPQIKNSNMRHRPLGIGVQGLADTFAMMDIVWGDERSIELNKNIFETIYYGATCESIKIAKQRTMRKEEKLMSLKNQWAQLIENYPENISKEDFLKREADIKQQIEETHAIITTYDSFEGSPASRGFLQFDLWNYEHLLKNKAADRDQLVKNGVYYINSSQELSNGSLAEIVSKYPQSKRYNWALVREELKKYGMRNSLLVALMPTASTAHLIGNNECFEPFTDMIYSRTVLSGQYMLVNKYMVNDLIDIGAWSRQIALDIINNRGSIQGLDIAQYINEPSNEIRKRFVHLQEKYRGVYDIKQKITCQLGIDRGRYICQTQSFNVFFKSPSYEEMTSLLFYQWKNGAKTGIYYLRSKPASEAIKFATVDTSKTNVKTEPIKPKKIGGKDIICTDEVCTVCQ